MAKKSKFGLPYLLTDRDRHGNERHYVRLPGKPMIRLRSDPNTEAFTTEYWAARNGEIAHSPRRASRAKAMKGTFGGLLNAFIERGLNDFSESTKKRKIRFANRLMKVGAELPIVIPDETIRLSLQAREDKPAAKYEFLKELRLIYKFGISEGLVDENPADHDFGVSKPKTNGFIPWDLSDCYKFEETWPVGTKARLVYALALYCGQRRSDVHRLGRQFEKDGRLRFTQFKNNENKGVDSTVVDIPIVAPLREAIDACPSGQMYYVVTDYGKPFTANGLGNKFSDWTKKAGLENRSLHGLRKAAGHRMAEAGCTVYEIMSVLGHSSPQEAEVYTRGADRKRMSDSAFNKTYKEQQ